MKIRRSGMVPGQRDRRSECRHSDVTLTPVTGSQFMELVLVAAVVAFVAFFVVIPAVWSKDPDRRASALEVLRVILSAFGRRPV
jgi:hypothetical protein